MKKQWFEKGFRHVRFYIENDKPHNLDEIEDVSSPRTATEPPSPEPRDQTSDSGFDLSRFFEEREEETRFISGEPVPTIISKLEVIAKLVSFTVRKKDCQVSLEGTCWDLEKVSLTITKELFERTPLLIEVKKKTGGVESQ
ncbi:CBL-interacting serine/threonine-protein kinase 12 [Platanthera zijinensis]|uniref:CBL-interacting serine/threonine-protein kinase 12 n=1 Tax=Platanthera zijinensis TaxID=2320716 RepID=A0AAP0BC72_9ASPA